MPCARPLRGRADARVRASDAGDDRSAPGVQLDRARRAIRVHSRADCAALDLLLLAPDNPRADPFAVGDVEAVLLRLDEARGLQYLEVLRDVRDALSGLRHERFDGARRLAEEVEQLEANRVRGGLPDPGELLVDGILEAPVRRVIHC